MSLYSERLATLKREISIIHTKKSKKFKKDQQIMIDFINGITLHAIFTFQEKNIFLYKGDEKKGFRHILEKHYCKDCPGKVTAIDILNMIDIVKKGLKLANKGVSNKKLIVYQRIKGLDHYKLILKPNEDGDLIVTMYSVG